MSLSSSKFSPFLSCIIKKRRTVEHRRRGSKWPPCCQREPDPEGEGRPLLLRQHRPALSLAKALPVPQEKPESPVALNTREVPETPAYLVPGDALPPPSMTRPAQEWLSPDCALIPPTGACASLPLISSHFFSSGLYIV